MKDFFDRAWSVRQKVAGKSAASFTCGGSSSNTALLSLEGMYPPFKLEKASEGLVWGLRDQGAPSEKDLTACKKIGETLANAALKKEIIVPEE